VSKQPVIHVEGVSKWFGDLVAVSEVTFSLGPGVTALLGPNGAGKSTVLRLLAGLTPPSQGTVRVLGGDPHRDLQLAGRVGLVPQQEAMFESLNGYEQVLLAARLQHLADPEAAARRALGIVEMDAEDARRIGAYSKGMRQRIKVAQALVHEPEVVFLDEPLTGLDPRQRRHLIDLFHRLGEEGRCVVVSSHVLEEVERFGSRVLVIAQGRLAAEGDFRAIRALMDDRPHRLRLRSDRARAVATALLAAGAVSGITLVDEGTALVETTDAPRFRSAVAGCAAREGARLLEVAPLDDDLESVFRYLVER
jgi:ABC-2 type transport system ATP-binding protein